MFNKRLVLAAIVSLMSVSMFAQDKTPAPKSTTPPPPPPKVAKEKKDEEIIIKKKGDGEKMTIVIEGDKITINGKPVDQLNEKDIEIIKGNADAIRLRGRLMTPNAPMAPMMIRSNRALLGVSMEKADKGVKVTEVSEGSAAEKAGIKSGDIITKAGAAKVTEPEELQKAITERKPGDTIAISLLRDGKEKQVNAVLNANRNASARVYKFNNDDFNFNFDMPKTPFPPSWNEDFGPMKKPRLGLKIQDVEEGTGVKVIDVEENSVAAKSGLQKDDIINKVNDKDVKNVDDLRNALKDVKEGEAYSVQYNRKGSAGKAEVKFPKKLKTANL